MQALNFILEGYFFEENVKLHWKYAKGTIAKAQGTTATTGHHGKCCGCHGLFRDLLMIMKVHTRTILSVKYFKWSNIQENCIWKPKKKTNATAVFTCWKMRMIFHYFLPTHTIQNTTEFTLLRLAQHSFIFRQRSLLSSIFSLLEYIEADHTAQFLLNIRLLKLQTWRLQDWIENT